jgi:hypothetical protein
MNVFAETLVRVLTAFVSDDGGSKWQERQIDELVQQGFVYARPIADTMAKEQTLSDEWLNRCLRACGRVVSGQEPKNGPNPGS